MKVINLTEIFIRTKWILLDQGLAATPYLTAQVKKNGGKFTSGAGREYRLPTREEVLTALKLAQFSLDKQP